MKFLCFITIESIFLWEICLNTIQSQVLCIIYCFIEHLDVTKKIATWCACPRELVLSGKYHRDILVIKGKKKDITKIAVCLKLAHCYNGLICVVLLGIKKITVGRATVFQLFHLK